MLTVGTDIIALCKDHSYEETWLVEGNASTILYTGKLADYTAGISIDLAISTMYVPDVCAAPVDQLPADTVEMRDAQVNITTSTKTTLTGLLKGDGANIAVAVPDVDYLSATSLAYMPAGISNKSADYNITNSDVTINCTSAMVATLPTAIGIAGKTFIIKNSSQGIVTVNTTSSQTIDGSTSIFLNSKTSLTTQSDGANWIII
jgi:hypothetical protein